MKTMDIKVIGDYCYFLGSFNDLKAAFHCDKSKDIYHSLLIIAIGIGIPENNIYSKGIVMTYPSEHSQNIEGYDVIFAVKPTSKSLFIQALKKFGIQAS